MDTLIGVVLFNTGFWMVIFSIQYFEFLIGRIRPNGPWTDLSGDTVPHLQRWWVMTLGEVVALSAIDYVVISAELRGEAHPYWLPTAAPLFGLFATIVFYKMATRSSRLRRNVDWWLIVNEGVLVKSTLAGKIHLVYYYLQMTIGATGVVFLLIGQFTTLEVVVGLVGVAVYALAVGLDIKQGHF